MDRVAKRLPNPAGMLFLAGVLGTLPAWIARVGLYQYIAIEVLIWCIYALGYNVALGYAGLPSFGHGAFFGIGAYGMAIYQLDFGGGSLWLGLAVATMAGGAAGAAVGMFISHRRGIYLSLMTIAFGQVAWFLAIRLRGITEGEDGLLDLARLPADLGLVSLDLQSGRSFYYFTLVVFMLTVVGLWMLTKSPFGAVIGAIRQNERRRGVRRLPGPLAEVGQLHALSGGLGARGRAVRPRPAQRLPRRDGPALVGDHRDDGDRRRGLGQLLGAGARRGLLLPGPRHHRRVHRDVASVVRPRLPAGHPVPTRGDRRHAPAGPGPVERAGGAPTGGGGSMTLDAGRTRRRGTTLRAVAGPNGAGGGDVPLYEAAGIHKRFGQQVVLERIDLRFESNRLSGIIGPNGAGKTTLFNVLTGELKPDRGTVRFKGRDITGASPDRITAMGAFEVVPGHEAVRRVHRARERGRPRCPKSAGRGSTSPATSPSTPVWPISAIMSWRASGSRMTPGRGQAACPTASGAPWTSRWRWRAAPRSCSWTSRPRAWAPSRWTRWPGSSAR